MIEAPQIQSMPSEDLVSRIQQGCDDAFAELVRRYQLDVRLFLARKLGNAWLADDLAQEVFWVAAQDLGRLQDGRRVRGWLLSIARHKAIDQLRRQLKQPRSAGNQLDLLLAQRQLNQISAESELEQAELQQVLRECLAKLKPASAQLVQRHYFQRQSAEQIAQETQRKGSAIRMALLRIRQVLAKCIRSQTDPVEP